MNSTVVKTVLGTFDRCMWLQRTYKELHPFRSGEYLPFNSIDCDILVDSGLPRPVEIDDLLPLRDLLRDVASEAVNMFKSAIEDSDVYPEHPEDFPLRQNLAVLEQDEDDHQLSKRTHLLKWTGS